MRILLDTQVFLWFLADSPKLSQVARKIVAEASEACISAATIWEVAIKFALGKLAVPPELVASQIGSNGFIELPIRARHALEVARLPVYHRDPFDRLLVAQAISEPLVLVTADALLERYSDQVIRIV